MNYKRSIFTVIIVLLYGLRVLAQPMTLSQAISEARTGSVEAARARQEFVSVYWAWRSYKASMLPSFTLYGNVGNFNRTLTLLQVPDDGSMKYVSTNNLQNSLGIRVSQNISFTGGTLQVYSDLNRIDQLGIASSITWYAQPVTVSYYQPLFAYNTFKWDRQIQPREYEKGRREYLTAMEEVAESTVAAYFNLLLSHVQWETSCSNYIDSRRLLDVAAERVRLGTAKRDEFLQLELRLLNDSLSINQNLIKLRESQMALNSLLGKNESREVEPVLEEEIPPLQLEFEDVLDRAYAHTPFLLEHEIQLLRAQASVAQAKASRGLSLSLNARFGLSKSGNTLPETLLDPLDQEVVGLTFHVPLFDWGEGKGRVQKARAAEEVVKAQVRQEENDYRRKLFTEVGRFNNQRNQCSVSRRALEIASERYSLLMARFATGNASVLELNNARADKDAALEQYIRDVGNYWQEYYALRRETLYDFLSGTELEIQENELID